MWVRLHVAREPVISGGLREGGGTDRAAARVAQFPKLVKTIV